METLSLPSGTLFLSPPHSILMIKTLSFMTLIYSASISQASPHQWIYALPIFACSLCVLLTNESSRVWRLLSGVVLLFTSTLSLFLISTLQSIASSPSIKLVETANILPLGISIFCLVSLRIQTSSNFLQSVLLYLIAATALLSVMYSITQYYIPMKTD